MITHGKGVVLSACRAAGALSVLFGVTLGAATHAAADVVRILHSDGDALQARVDLVQQAKQEINVSYYIVGDDEVPLLFLSLLRDAARRGVTVRLLVDGHDGDNQMPRALAGPSAPRGRRDPGISSAAACSRLLDQEPHARQAADRRRRAPDHRRAEPEGRLLRAGLQELSSIATCTSAAARRPTAQCYFMARWESGNVCPTRLSGRINQKKHGKGDDAPRAERRLRRGGHLHRAATCSTRRKSDAESCQLVKFDTGTRLVGRGPRGRVRPLSCTTIRAARRPSAPASPTTCSNCWPAPSAASCWKRPIWCCRRR